MACKCSKFWNFFQFDFFPKYESYLIVSFYGCARIPTLSFFKWEDDVEKSTNEIDKHEQLEVEIGPLVNKILKLKHKKRTMEEVVTSLKVENAKLNGTVKALGIMLVFS